MAQWFILQNDLIEGPFSTDQVKAWAESHPSDSKAMVWGKAQTDWRPIQWWLVEAPDLIKKIHEVQDDRLWHYAVGGKAHGPFTRGDLIGQLKELPMTSDLLLWTKGMPAWAPIFDFYDILNEIGVNRRQHPRADIEGKISFSVRNQTVQGRLLTISEGGLGFDGVPGLQAGDILNTEIDSDSFYDPITVKIEVRYINEHGFVGCRFHGLGSEARSSIIQYVRQSGRTVVRAA